jgi:hypothetical protein
MQRHPPNYSATYSTAAGDPDCDLAPIRQVELGEDLLDVVLRSALGEVEPGGDRPVGQHLRPAGRPVAPSSSSGRAGRSAPRLAPRTAPCRGSWLGGHSRRPTNGPVSRWIAVGWSLSSGLPGGSGRARSGPRRNVDGPRCTCRLSRPAGARGRWANGGRRSPCTGMVALCRRTRQEPEDSLVDVRGALDH